MCVSEKFKRKKSSIGLVSVFVILLMNLVFNGRSTSAVGFPEMEQPGTASVVFDADTVQSSVITVGTSSWSSLEEQDAFIQTSLEAVDAALVFAGYCRLGDQTPDPANNQAYLALDAGTIFGNEVEELQFLVGNGTGFDVLEVEEVSSSVITIPSVISSQLLTSEIDYNAEDSGIAETTGTTTAYSYSVIPGQERDSISVVQDGDADYSVQSSGTTALLSVVYEKGDQTEDPYASKLTVLNQRAGNNVKVESQSYVAPAPVPVDDSEGIDFGMEGDYFVSSSTGSDSNDGLSSDRPKKTLAAITALNPKAGTKVALKASDVWRETLTPTTAGTSGSVVTYGAYGVGEKPRISGCEVVTGWTRYSGNIYRANVSSDVKQVFVDGEFVSLAKLPKAGFHTISSYSGSSFTSSDINGSLNYAGGTVIYRNTLWTTASAGIVSSSGQTLVTNNTKSAAAGDGLVILNTLSCLTQENEWYYDSANDYLYLWVEGGSSPDSHVVEASVKDYCVQNSRAYVKFENLDLFGAAKDNFYLSSGTNQIIDYCDINYARSSGVNGVSASPPYLTVSNSNVFGCGAYGINANSIYLTVTGNTIEDIGLMKYWNPTTPAYVGQGVQARSENVTQVFTFTYNTIRNVAYCGISFFSNKNIVSYNYVENANVVCGDGGGIYTFRGSGQPRVDNSCVISYNIVTGCMGSSAGWHSSYTGASGIYLDDYTSGFTVENNVVTNCAIGIQFHNNVTNTARNNLLVANGVAFLNAAQQGTSSFNNNTVVGYSDMNSSMPWWTDSYQRMVKLDAGALPNMDNNSYYHKNRSTPFAAGGAYDQSTFSTWKSVTGKDANSEFVNNYEGQEQLFFNNENQVKMIGLQGIWTDFSGNSIDNLTLQPFTGKILLKY